MTIKRFIIEGDEDPRGNKMFTEDVDEKYHNVVPEQTFVRLTNMHVGGFAIIWQWKANNHLITS